MKKGMMIGAVLALAVGSQAQVIYWADSDGIGNWATATNWDLSVVPSTTNSHTLINSMTTVWPTVDSNVPNVNLLGIGWDSPTGELNVIDGAAQGAVSVWVGYHSVGTLNVSGGTITAIVTLQLGQDDATGGSGTINLTGDGLFYSIDTTPTWVNGSVINISGPDAGFLINGNQTNQTWVADGLIVAPDAGEYILVSYIPTQDRTIFQARPVAGPAENLTISSGAGEVVLSWTAEAQGTYGIETNLDLTASADWGLWQTGLEMPGGGTLNITNAVSVDETFYRVITE